MSNSSSSLLNQTAVLNDDVILESPNIPIETIKVKRKLNAKKLRKNVFEAFVKTLNPDEVIYDKTTFENSPSFPEIIPNQQYLDKISEKGLETNFANVHIYRTISEIINLENCTFRFDNLRIIGIYKYGKINEQSCHYIEERQTGKKIEIDLNLVDQFPSQNSTYLFFGAIKLKTVNFEPIQFILIKFFQDLPNPEKCETVFNLQKKYRPREFDFIVSFDVTCAQSTLGFYETFIETKGNTIFDDFDDTLFLNKIESDEMLYYEIERLMNININ